MFLAIDVDYREDQSAVAAGVIFTDWRSSDIDQIITCRIEQVAPYQPGRFFERELPCLLSILKKAPLPQVIIIDGYVTLGAERRDGLGAHLYHALDEAIPVIGVAKNRFKGTPEEAEVLRGVSAKPLYVTSCGIDEGEVRELVRQMHGAHRLPTILAAVDRACREG